MARDGEMCDDFLSDANSKGYSFFGTFCCSPRCHVPFVLTDVAVSGHTQF